MFVVVVFYFVQLLSEETFFQICDPSATLIFNSMFVVGVLYCVQLFIDVFSFVQNPSLLSFSFPLLKLFSFYFLSSIFKISKCLISLNIGCLIKTPLKTAVHHLPCNELHLQHWHCTCTDSASLERVVVERDSGVRFIIITVMT